MNRMVVVRRARPLVEGPVKEETMSTNAVSLNSGKTWLLSLDSWAVVAALLAALLIRAGVFTRIPW
jgi:hypothetical protein